MFHDHYPALVVAYFVGLCGWLLAQRVLPRVWPAPPPPFFAHPWRECGFALLGAVGIIAMGQLWTRGIRLPEDGTLGPLLAAINQLLIFAPILLVVVMRRQPWTTAWLPREHLATRVLVGLLLSCLAVSAYALAREGAAAPWIVIGKIWRYDHIDELVQVLLEDITIAILFVRLAAAISPRWATVVVACLFAAGHVPVMIEQGATLAELGSLMLDASLGVAVILVLQRSRDIVWFACIHFALDLTQFARVGGAA